MRATRDGICGLCDQKINDGDEIVRGNKSGSYGNGWVHVGCKPVSGSFTKAQYAVKLHYPQGIETRQFVSQKVAEKRAESWRRLLQIKVEVMPI